MGLVKCALCEDKLRSDIALMDAEWETMETKAGTKYVCRQCAKKIAHFVISEY